MKRSLVILISVAAILLPLSSSRGGDWPQILGPDRNGKAAGETLMEKWPAKGPAILWRQKLGSGYAGPAVVGSRVVIFHRVGRDERAECLDAVSGKSLWKADFPASYRGGVNPDTGPRCVPLIAGERVYLFGAAGHLHAVGLPDGQKLWSRDLYGDYRGDEGYFGAGSTPLLFAGKLLVNVGGEGAGLVALDPATGNTLWKGTEEAASYSSPTSVRLAGQERALFITRMNCLAVDPANGKAELLFPFGKRGPTVNAAMPVVFDGKLLTTASYGVGAVCAALEGASARPLWSGDDTLSSQYATPVEHGGMLYGIHGREDLGVAELRCIEAASGKIRWKEPDFGVAHLILAGDKLLIQTVAGQLALAAADPSQYRELARASLTAEPTRALPALAAGRLFVRTGSEGGELICLRVGK